MEAGFKKADALIQKNAKEFKKAGKVMTAAGATILGVVTGCVKAYGDFDKAMTESTAIMGNVSDAMKSKMAETAKQMSEESTFAAKELAQSYFYLASAGLDAEQSIAALPIVTKFAQAGAFDLTQATDLLTDAQSALGLSSKDAAINQKEMGRVSDVLVKANTLANASVSQFSEALTSKAGPAMRAYGVELEEGVAVLAAFADQGVKGRLAGEKYSIVLRDLQKSAMENKTAFEKAGVAVYDASGNLNNMGDIVGQLETRLSGMSAEQKKAELAMLGFQEESQMALLTLVGTSEKIKDYETNLRNAKGVTEEIAEKQLKSLTNQLTLAKNSIVNTAISLGEQLAPMVVELAGKIKETVGKIRDWIKEHPELTRGIALTAAKAGVLLTVLGPITMMLPGLIAGIKLLGSTSVIASIGLGKLGLAAIVTYGAYKGLLEIRERWEKSKGKFTSEETKRWVELEKAVGRWGDFVIKAAAGLREVGGEATIQGEKVESLNDIWHLYGENTRKTLGAIAKGEHGAALKKFLEDLGGEHLRAALRAGEQGKSLDQLTKDAENFIKSLEKGLPLPSKLAQEFDAVVELVETQLYPGLNKLSPMLQRVVSDSMKPTGELKEEFLNLSTIFPEVLEPSILNMFEVLKNAQAKLRTQVFETAEDWKSKFFAIAEVANVFVNGLDACFYQHFQNVMIGIDNEEKRWLESIDLKYNATIAANEAIVEAERAKTEEMLKAIDDEYNATTLANKAILDDKRVKTEETLKAIDDEYNKKKQYILDNVTDEEERASLLADLERKRELDLERAREERKQAEEEEYKLLADLARKHELDLEQLRNERKLAEEKAATDLLAIEEAKNEALRLASEELERKREAARRTAAKQEKAVALLSAIVNTAAAVVKALPNIPLAIAIGIMGAAQIALIAAQPIPLAEGGIVMQPTMALIGEKGPEAVIPLNRLQPAFAGFPGSFKVTVYNYGDINNSGDLDEISRRLAEKTRRAIERGRK